MDWCYPLNSLGSTRNKFSMASNGTVWLWLETNGTKTRGTEYPLKMIAYSLDSATGVATATLNTPKNLNALRALQACAGFEG